MKVKKEVYGIYQVAQEIILIQNQEISIDNIQIIKCDDYNNKFLLIVETK